MKEDTTSANSLTPTLLHMALPNADTPAFPTNSETEFPGLTKREYIAVGVFHAQLPYSDAEIEELARLSVLIADVLLASLEAPVASGGDDTELDQ
jgi:hypothetical protein